MPHQVALTVVAPVQPTRLGDLRAVLATMAIDPGGNAVIPFAAVEGVHFARLFLMEPVTDLRGQAIPPELIFMADFDAPLEERLERLLEVAEPGLNRLFETCEGYPDHADRHGCLAYLRGHVVRDAAVYVNTVGLGAAQIHGESRLRDALQDRLDQADDLRDAGSTALRKAMVDWVAATPDLAWGLSAPEPPSLAWRLKELAHMLLLPLVGLLLLPLIILALPFWLILLRLHERSDAAPDIRPAPAHVEQLASLEDHGPVNQFTAGGFIKPGRLRAVTARIVLFLIAYAVRHVFNRANLAGVKTIHFARWTYIDGGQRVIFASNYDGSLESYMDDFIDKIAWGLNAVFSNGLGYPSTRWLVLGGARNEHAFKNHLLVNQFPTQVWYAAYGGLTAANVANNSAIRTGLHGAMSDAQAATWLRRL